MSNTSTFKEIMESAIKAIPTKETIDNINEQISAKGGFKSAIAKSTVPKSNSVDDRRHREDKGMCTTMNTLEEMTNSYQNGDIDKKEFISQCSDCLKDYSDKYGIGALSNQMTNRDSAFRAEYPRISGRTRLDYLLESPDGRLEGEGDIFYDKYEENKVEVDRYLDEANYTGLDITPDEYCERMSELLVNDIDRTQSMRKGYERALESMREIHDDIAMSIRLDTQFE